MQRNQDIRETTEGVSHRELLFPVTFINWMNFHSQCISKRTKRQAVLSDRIHLFLCLMTTWDVGSYSVCSM